mmetsp:Transcript_15793/g.30878  ORF Transcript_15793/g.30878 Transcript_15793/m.30878 type:complete len:276 (-) Transcript_15793:133-960(-)
MRAIFSHFSLNFSPQHELEPSMMKDGRRRVSFLGAFSSPSHAMTPKGKQVAVEGLRLMAEMRSFQKIFGAENCLMLPAASWEDLIAASKNVSPALIHLSGHCFKEQWVFEGQSREVSCVSGDELGKLFLKMKGLRAVILSGCQSSCLGHAVKKRVGDEVQIICSTTKLNNAFASAFCADFYKKLAEHEIKDSKEDFIIGKAFRETISKYNFGKGTNTLKFGDPSPMMHRDGDDGGRVLDFDHLGNPHPTDSSGNGVYSEHCLRCNPQCGGKFEII